MNLFYRLIASTLPLVPKRIVGAISSRYIAGETREQMVECVRRLNDEGVMCTVDVLGEDTKARSQAEETVIEYESAKAELQRLRHK